MGFFSIFLYSLHRYQVLTKILKKHITSHDQAFLVGVVLLCSNDEIICLFSTTVASELCLTYLVYTYTRSSQLWEILSKSYKLRKAENGNKDWTWRPPS